MRAFYFGIGLAFCWPQRLSGLTKGYVRARRGGEQRHAGLGEKTGPGTPAVRGIG
jgi:hypothetical protein